MPSPDTSNLERLAAALEGLDAQLSGVDADRLGAKLDAPTLAEGANFTLETRCGPLDLMQKVPGGPPYAELSARAATVTVRGIEVRVCALEDLVAMKAASGRLRDQQDVADLRAAHSE